MVTTNWLIHETYEDWSFPNDWSKDMPAKSEKQRKMMGADLERAREGKKTRTGMNERQLREFAKKPKKGRK